MICEWVRDRLDDYAAGRLQAGDADRVRSHLKGCAECRLDLEAARALAPLVPTLPRSVLPQRSLWEGIERRMVRSAPRLQLRRLLPLAAALALVAGSSLVAVWRLRKADSVPGPVPQGVALQVARYQAAASDLAGAALADPPRLVPAAAHAVRRDLQVLDGAIRESDQALRKDPENPALQELLLSAHRKKLAVLRQAVALAVQG